jgi:putative ABC transport system substrate-binding protein
MNAITWPEVSRRTFVATLAGGLVAAPLAAEAQQAGKVWRIGVLSPGGPPTRTGSSELLRQSLRELGYVEGLNLAIDWRYAEGKTERFDHLAAELVRLKVDVIVATVPRAPTPPICPSSSPPSSNSSSTSRPPRRSG